MVKLTCCNTTIILFLAFSIGVYKLVFTGTKRVVEPETDSILITGSSSGIGRHAALAMNAIGFTVFAGIRKYEDGETLKKLSVYPEKFIPVVLDVTSEEQIAAAFEFVSKHVGEDGLTAVYNNAGVGNRVNAKSTSVENNSIEDYKWRFETNYYGSIRIIQAFLPLVKLKGEKGRIIFNTSIFGFFSPPFFSAYTSTKYALEALADSLRREIWIYKTKVSIIEPGVILTKMSCTLLLQSEQSYKDFETHYPHEKIDQRKEMMNADSPKVTTDALIDSVLNSIPSHRYVVGGSSFLFWIFSKIPSSITDKVLKLVEESVMSKSDMETIKHKCSKESFDPKDYTIVDHGRK